MFTNFLHFTLKKSPNRIMSKYVYITFSINSKSLLTVLLHTLALPHVWFVGKCDRRSLQKDE